jgi:hypothetical protein
MRPLSLFLLLLAAPLPVAAQPALPVATPKEIQLRTQLGEALWELAITQAALAAAAKERDELKAAAQKAPNQ